MVRYELDIGARHFGKFGTISVWVLDTSDRSVRSLNTDTRRFGEVLAPTQNTSGMIYPAEYTLTILFCSCGFLSVRITAATPCFLCHSCLAVQVS